MSSSLPPIPGGPISGASNVTWVTGIDGIHPPCYYLWAYSVATIVIVWTSYFLRAYIRIVMLRVYGSDDYLMGAAVISYTLLSIFDILMVEQGFGNPEIPATARSTASKWLFLHELFYFVSVTFARLSICFFYLRITPVRWQRWLIYGVATVNILMATMAFFANLFTCSPVSYNWTLFLDPTTGSCNFFLVSQGFGPAQNSISIISDFILSFLPLFLLKGSNLNARLKLVVIILLGIGIISGVASIIRYYEISKLNASVTDTQTVYTSLWTTIEPFACIVAGNIATYRPLFRRMLENVTKYYTNNRTTQKVTNPKSTLSGSRGPLSSHEPQARAHFESKSDVNLVLQDFGPSSPTPTTPGYNRDHSHDYSRRDQDRNRDTDDVESNYS